MQGDVPLLTIESVEKLYVPVIDGLPPSELPIQA
jgi:hypothetical protein